MGNVMDKTTWSAVQFQKIRDEAIMPTRSNPWDAGLDLYASEDVYLPWGRVTMVPTALAVAIPQGFAGLVTTRSGYGKKGLIVANSPGVVDAGYRGELFVMILNHENFGYTGCTGYEVKRGDRVAQMLLTPVLIADPIEVETLPASDGRGTNGFGSTGS
jgi:dUTP pyrophosphatase